MSRCPWCHSNPCARVGCGPDPVYDLPAFEIVGGVASRCENVGMRRGDDVATGVLGPSFRLAALLYVSRDHVGERGHIAAVNRALAEKPS